MEFVVNNTMKQNPSTNRFEEIDVKQANIKIIGCGGAGNNMVNWLYKKGIKGAEIIACNTDQQHLNMIESDRKFLIGKEGPRGKQVNVVRTQD